MKEHFQERLEQYQTPFTVFELNKMYTGIFTFIPADKDRIYDPTKLPYHKCPAHHQFDDNLVSWRLKISEVDFTYDDTANVMIVDGHTVPCYFADGFCQATSKILFTLVWFSDDFGLIFTLQDFLGRTTKSEDLYCRYPNTGQTYDFATPIACDNNPRNLIELDPDSDDQDFYILEP